MPVLRRRWRLSLCSLLAIAPAACDRGTPAYRHIKDLPYSEWTGYAASLPVEQALDLNKEIEARSGHNPPMTIVGSFSTRPAVTYMSLVRRIRTGDDSLSYLGIIYEIDRSADFSICDQPDRKFIQQYLWRNATSAVGAEDRADFYRC